VIIEQGRKSIRKIRKEMSPGKVWESFVSYDFRWRGTLTRYRGDRRGEP
jgi:hypothetical protein